MAGELREQAPYNQGSAPRVWLAALNQPSTWNLFGKGGRRESGRLARQRWNRMPIALLIEDDARIARLLRLEMGRANWAVTWRAMGQDGLAAVRSQTFDLVILDVMLPDTDGWSVCRAVREQSDVPILMLTARDAVADRVIGLDAGADDYVTKPFFMVEFMARVRALIRRRVPDPMNDWICVGGLRVSVVRHEVRVRDGLVALTGREFSLLRYFMENAAIALTRQMILDHVWGWGYTGSSAIVDVYVGYLRHKLEIPGVTAHIVTIRGVGYMMQVADVP